MVSVCVATYNGARFIEAQLSSILAQIGLEDEVIISDDSSTDSTIEVIETFKDSRIKIFKNNKFKSAVLNFEFALSKAKGDIIFLSDQDDIWMQGKVNAMLKELEAMDLVVSDCIFINATGELLDTSKSFFDIYNSGPGLIKNIIKNTYIGNSMAFRKELLQYSLPFPKIISMMPNLDHGLWLGILANTRFKIGFLPQKLLLYRRHDSNVSPTSPSRISPNSLYVKLKARILLIFFLIKHIVTKFFNLI